MWHQFWTRRRTLKLGVLVVGISLIAWLGLSLLAVIALTSRSKSPYSEQVPRISDLEVEEQRLQTSDGETIGSWYLPGKSQFPTVLLIHGNGGDRATRWPQALLLHEAGYSVMLITCRAHGDSTGKWNDFGYGALHGRHCGSPLAEIATLDIANRDLGSVPGIGCRCVCDEGDRE